MKPLGIVALTSAVALAVGGSFLFWKKRKEDMTFPKSVQYRTTFRLQNPTENQEIALQKWIKDMMPKATIWGRVNKGEGMIDYEIRGPQFFSLGLGRINVSDNRYPAEFSTWVSSNERIEI